MMLTIPGAHQLIVLIFFSPCDLVATIIHIATIVIKISIYDVFVMIFITISPTAIRVFIRTSPLIPLWWESSWIAKQNFSLSSKRVCMLSPLSSSRSISHSVVSDSLRPHGLCPWTSPGKSTGVSCHALLQGIFLTQGLNPCLSGLLY